MIRRDDAQSALAQRTRDPARVRKRAHDFTVDCDRPDIRQDFDAANIAGRWQNILMKDAEAADGAVEDVDARTSNRPGNRLRWPNPLETTAIFR